MEKKKIVFATNNAHKLSELRGILGDRFDIVSLAEIGCFDDIPETSDTLEGNALQKARYVFEKYNVGCFADDSGLEVDALNGAPGIYTARFGAMNGFGDDHDTCANTRCLLSKLDGVEDRKACFRTVIALIDESGERMFQGRVDGVIPTEERGDGGFGYDPVFIPEGYTESFAQLGVDVKNKISHRARAAEALAQYLNTL